MKQIATDPNARWFLRALSLRRVNSGSCCCCCCFCLRFLIRHKILIGSTDWRQGKYYLYYYTSTIHTFMCPICSGKVLLAEQQTAGREASLQYMLYQPHRTTYQLSWTWTSCAYCYTCSQRCVCVCVQCACSWGSGRHYPLVMFDISVLLLLLSSITRSPSLAIQQYKRRFSRRKKWNRIQWNRRSVIP